MASSSSRVLAIPELLEIMLQDIPPRDLLFCQRVNTRFRDVIRSSQVLQRRLYLNVELVTKDTYVEEIKWNPFLNLLWDKDHVWDYHGIQKMRLEKFYHRDPDTAAWKNMFITNPAVNYLWVIAGRLCVNRVESKSGITVGQLVRSQQDRYNELESPDRSEALTGCFSAKSSWIPESQCRCLYANTQQD